MSKITAAVNWAIGIAEDDSHGYQWGGWGPDYDCSHLVIMAWENAGVCVREAGASYTGNMRLAFLSCGFNDVVEQTELSTGAGLQIGDVLLNQANHAAMYIGNGRIVQARSNYDGISGDSDGQEIRTQSYYNYPWDCVLRYNESSAKSTSTAAATGTTAQTGYTPLVCIMSQSTCYRGTSKMTVKGVLWHSTGANNPWLKRYVQPDDNASNKAELIAKLGTNTNKNDWNHISVQAGVNAFVGKLADGTVASVQTLPWDYKPWGCGGGCNNGWIQFEICEDGLGDRSYFNTIYDEAVKLTAYLCKMYSINPYGMVGNVPTILCHQDSYKLGMGSNHEDVYHWFNRYGKTMDNVRDDVAAILGTSGQAVKYGERELGRDDNGEDVKELQTRLNALGYSLVSDGYFGKETEAAVRKFQSEHQLTADGIAGKQTFAALERATKSQQNDQPVAVSNATYTVQKGDTLWSLALRYLGSGLRWKEIQKLNELNTIIIQAGQILKLPDK